VSGTLHVRDWEPYERRSESADGGFRPRATASPDARQLPIGSTG